MRKMEGLSGEEIRLATCRCGGDAIYRAGAVQQFKCDKCGWATPLEQSAYDAVAAWQDRNQCNPAFY